MGSFFPIDRIMESYLARGLEHLNSENFDEAIACFNRYLMIRPGDELPYCYRGHAFHRKGDCDRAIRDLTRAIAIGLKFNWFAHYDRGCAFEEKGDLEMACDDYRQCLEFADPDDSQMEREIADIRRRLEYIEKKRVEE